MGVRSPLTPTLSPLEKGGEGVGSGGMLEGHFERPRPTERVRWGLVPPKKKVYNGKWHNSTLPHSESRGSPSLRRLYRTAETA